MWFKHQYPYVNFHDINLNWILGKVRELAEDYKKISDDMSGIYDYIQDALINNVDETVKELINQMIEDGSLEEIIMDAFNNLDERVKKLEDSYELIFPSFNTNGYGELLDTNGSCVIVKTKNKTLMVDTFLSSTNYIGIKQSLKKHDIEKLDYLIITHYHSDHYGNLELLVNDINCDDTTFIIPRITSNPNISENLLDRYNSVLNILQGKNIVIADNDVLDLDGVEIKLFNSSQEDYDSLDISGTNIYNNYSIVVDIQYKKSKVLLLSDIYKEAQQLLIDKDYVMSDYDIIQDAHHGLANAYIPFANQISPKNVIVQSTIRMTNTIINYPSRNILNSLWASMTDNIIYTGYNSEETSYIINDNVELTSKSFSFPNNAQNVSLEIIVDSSKDNHLRRDGSLKYPFHSVGEACHFLNNKIRQNTTINVINCDNVKTYINGLNGRVVINFNNNEIPLIQIDDCYGEIIIQNAKIKRVDNSRCINIFRSLGVQLQSCELDGNNISYELLRCDNSSLYITQKLTIKNINTNTLCSLYNTNFSMSVQSPSENLILENSSSSNFMTGIGSTVSILPLDVSPLLNAFGNIATSGSKPMNIFSSSIN